MSPSGSLASRPLLLCESYINVEKNSLKKQSRICRKGRIHMGRGGVDMIKQITWNSLRTNIFFKRQVQWYLRKNTRGCTLTSSYMHTYVQIHPHMYSCTHMNPHAQMHPHTHTHIMYEHRCAHKCATAPTHVYSHTHVYTHMKMQYTHVKMYPTL